jgi:hypothetical protein
LEQYEYLDCLIDFDSAVKTYGADKVAADFHMHYPNSNHAFIVAALKENKQRQVAALFKPVYPQDNPKEE